MTVTDEVEREALPTLKGLPHAGTRPDIARLIASLDQSSADFEPASLRYATECREVLGRGILHEQGQDSFRKLWLDGVVALDWFARWQFVAKVVPSIVRLHPYGFAAMVKVAPRIASAMTALATTWLTPRLAGESRGVLYERIKALRPVEQNKQLQELMEKNNEGTITAKEYAELVRLNEFFDTLQAIIDDAITFTHLEQSAVVIDAELSQYERACAGFDALRPDARAEVDRRWRHGVTLFDALQAGETHPDELSRLQTAVTALATRWLRRRSPGEPNDRVVERIAALKVPELNDRLGELMPKNAAGTLTPEERAEFEGLHDRLDFFQDALSAAIQALPPGGS